MMFNDTYNLTQAVLNGTKTKTRRVLKGNVSLGNWEETAKKLPYKVGEVVAVAQSYREVLECVPAYNDILLDDRGSLYKEYKAGYK